MPQLLFEVSNEDQIFVENECSDKGFSFENFFKMLLDDYKDKSTIAKEAIEAGIVEEEEAEEEKPKRGKKKKT